MDENVLDNETVKDIMKKGRTNHQRLYEEDIIYKSLVDNHIKESIKYEKKLTSSKKDESVDSSEYVKAANAIHTYTEELIDKKVLEIVKSVNITNEDLRDMIRQNIIPPSIVAKMFKFKFRKDDKNE